MGLPDRMEEQICNEVNGIKSYQTQTIASFLIVAVEKSDGGRGSCYCLWNHKSAKSEEPAP